MAQVAVQSNNHSSPCLQRSIEQSSKMTSHIRKFRTSTLRRNHTASRVRPSLTQKYLQQQRRTISVTLATPSYSAIFRHASELMGNPDCDIIPLYLFFPALFFRVRRPFLPAATARLYASKCRWFARGTAIINYHQPPREKTNTIAATLRNRGRAMPKVLLFFSAPRFQSVSVCSVVVTWFVGRDYNKSCEEVTKS